MKEIDIYDFDYTIYNGDSTVDFWKFCLKKNPLIFFLIPYQIFGFGLAKMKVMDGAKGKSMFFSFLRFIDGEKRVDEFWAENESKINSWFLPVNRERDAVVCSASPEFLLRGICKKYDAQVVATVCDIKSGKITGKNCRSDEKVRRLSEIIDLSSVNCVYSDSKIADAPIFALAKTRFWVQNGEITKF